MILRVTTIFCVGLLLVLGYTACSTSPGRRIYIDWGCVRCHGASLSGSTLGPPLKGLRSVWTREALVRYLENPQAYTQKDPRLKALAARYQAPMPKFVMDGETRRVLAEFLLAQSE